MKVALPTLAGSEGEPRFGHETRLRFPEYMYNYNCLLLRGDIEIKIGLALNGSYICGMRSTMYKFINSTDSQNVPNIYMCLIDRDLL